MEEKVLLTRLENLENRISALEDRAEIENLYAKHNFLFSSGQGRRIVDELWSENDDASIEYGASGVYRNLWKVKTFYVNYDTPGRLLTFAAANRWLRLDSDALSARGVWMVYGTETDSGDLGSIPPEDNDQRRVLLSSKDEKGHKYRSEILFQKHEVEFTKENGTWKIFSLHISEFFRYPAGSDWVKYAKERQMTDGMWLEYFFETPDPIPSFENLPNGPTSYHWQYDTDAKPCLQFDLED